MPRSIHASFGPAFASYVLGLVWLVWLASLVGCARTSDNPPIVSAPVASATPAAASDTATATAAPSASLVASSSPSASAAPTASAMVGALATATDDPDGGTAQYRACQADSECVAVKRNGCCFNGHMFAVNAAQKDAYAQSFTCPQRRPMCPMYMIRDRRLPKCDTSAHLCVMFDPQQP